MIIKCKKQFIALFMAISVIFCVGSESYIKVEALEWAVPTITAGEAIKWLLGLLGVTVAGGALANTDYEQLAENYTEYAHQQGLSAVETGKFWSDIIDGSLDTGSQAWSKFKEWIQSNLFSSSDKINVSSDNVFGISSFDYFKIDTSNLNKSYQISNQYYFKITSLPSHFDDNITAINFTSFGLPFFASSLSLSGLTYNVYRVSDDSLYSSMTLRVSSTYTYNDYKVICSLPNANYALSTTQFQQAWLSIFGEYGSDGIFNSAYPNIDNIALILSNAISNAIPDVIPLPWDQVAGTAEGINDKIDELIEKVNTGVMSLEDYMAAIQAILGVIAFDTTNDLVIPADPDLPDETIKDKINDNVANNGFVLTGLENFFPFCIPFDIYAFITILVADPVAPVIHWEIYNPVTKENNEIVLDFAMWESIVVLMRYIFDFLFIIGLALISRSLIGGDD